MHSDRVICANVGDSRAVIGKKSEKGWTAVPLSDDHKPDNPDERRRIQRNGGEVEAVRDFYGTECGPARVWVANSNPRVPGLAMSRCIGDSVAQEVGVIPNPDIIEYTLTYEDKFMILASDGVWEFISNERAVEIVSTYWT
jgi:serine/threonine protein phosphatase PrpC